MPWWRSQQSRSFWARKEGTATQLTVMENFSLTARLQLKQSSKKEAETRQTEKEWRVVNGVGKREKDQETREMSLYTSSLGLDNQTHGDEDDDWENVDATVQGSYCLRKEGCKKQTERYHSSDACDPAMRRNGEEREDLKDGGKQVDHTDAAGTADNTRTAVLARVNVNPILV